MTYGEKYTRTLKNRITGETFLTTATYRRVSWKGWHTSDDGDGLWCGDKQILGTCQFSVAGCSTEKSAKDKIRRWVKGSLYDFDPEA